MPVETRSGAAQITIGTGAGAIVLTEDDQLEDARLQISRDQFEHKTQRSSKPVKYVVTGIEPKLMVSIASITLDRIATVFNSTVQQMTSDATRKRVLVKDDAGAVLTGKQVVIKPYPILTVPAANGTAPTAVGAVVAAPVGLRPGTAGDAQDTWDAAKAAYDAYVVRKNNMDAYNARVAANVKYRTWVSSWVTLPNAAITDINSTELAFGLQTQQRLGMTFTGLPLETVDNAFLNIPVGTRMYFGDAGNP